jgi:glucose/arabinose dehydrogenase
MRRLPLALLLLACRPRAGAPPDARLVTTPRAVAPDAPSPPDPCTGVGNPLAVRLLPGFCLRPVATGLLRPRQMALAPDGSVLVAESGAGWRHNRGRVSRLARLPDGGFTVTPLATALDRPHGVAFHDGHVWVAEAGRVARFRYPVGGELTLEPVVSGLPSDGRHIHKTLGFAPDGALFFSVGSATDNCQRADSREADDPCPERAPVAPAVERGVVMRWDAQRGRASVYSRGLRNNTALAWHPASGRLWGVENSRDYIDRADPSLSDTALPHDELNELTRGSDHGWPYCYDANALAPEYRAHPARCRAQTPPALALPPHAAPLAITFYDGGMFPAAYRGRALVAYHGYRAEGHRVVSIPFGADGAPSGPPEDFISGWEERPDRPHGRLAGLLVTPEGSLLVSDDGSGTVYELRYGASALRAPPPAVVAPAPEDPAAVERRCAELARRTDALSVMQRTVIDPKCVSCHVASAGSLFLRRCDWRATWESLARGRSAAYGPYVVPGRADQGVLMARLRGDTMGPRMPMQGVTLTAEELAAVERWVTAGAPAP